MILKFLPGIQSRALWPSRILWPYEGRTARQETASEVHVHQVDCHVHLLSVLRGELPFDELETQS